MILYALWDLLVLSASANADQYIFRVISNQFPNQCLQVLSKEALTHVYIRLYNGIPGWHFGTY